MAGQFAGRIFQLDSLQDYAGDTLALVDAGALTVSLHHKR